MEHAPNAAEGPLFSFLSHPALSFRASAAPSRDEEFAFFLAVLLAVLFTLSF